MIRVVSYREIEISLFPRDRSLDLRPVATRIGAILGAPVTAAWGTEGSLDVRGGAHNLSPIPDVDAFSAMIERVRAYGADELGSEACVVRVAAADLVGTYY